MNIIISPIGNESRKKNGNNKFVRSCMYAQIKERQISAHTQSVSHIFLYYSNIFLKKINKNTYSINSILGLGWTRV